MPTWASILNNSQPPPPSEPPVVSVNVLGAQVPVATGEPSVGDVVMALEEDPRLYRFCEDAYDAKTESDFSHLNSPERGKQLYQLSRPTRHGLWLRQLCQSSMLVLHDIIHANEPGKQKVNVQNSVRQKYDKGKLVDYKSACLCDIEHEVNGSVSLYHICTISK